MKIGILTYYNVHNHGALLQANALKLVLQQLGHEVVFLSFQRNYDNIPIDQAKKYKLGLSSIPFFIRYAHQKGISNILYNLAKRITLDKFRKDHIPLGGGYSDFDGDIVVIGSDEVFSQEVGVNPFLYGHELAVKKIISYAGSFGPTTIEDIEQLGTADLVRSGLCKMFSVGVRDENSRTIVDTLGIPNASIVIDPVLLYGYAAEIQKSIPKQRKYLLLYTYDRNTNLPCEVEEIRRFARNHGLKILSVGYHHRWCDKSINVSPEQLLAYVKNAEFVITDTFHGAVLSILCNTQFSAKVRNNSNKLQFLLQEYGLQGRLVQDFSMLESVANKPIDYCSVNQILVQRRAESRRFLIDSINKC